MIADKIFSSSFLKTSWLPIVPWGKTNHLLDCWYSTKNYHVVSSVLMNCRWRHLTNFELDSFVTILARFLHHQKQGDP